MKAVCYMKPGIALCDIPDPQQPDIQDWVKIKTAYVGICGTDAHFMAGHFDDQFDALGMTKGPIPIGHEVVGVVEDIAPGATAKGLKVGDKVAFYFNNHCGKCHYCRNGQEHMCTSIEANLFAGVEHFYAAEQQVYKLPEGISLKQGALSEPVSFCMHTVDLGGVKSGDTVVISGGGAIGLTTLQLAKHAGASKITVIEPVAEKRKIALELGAHYAIDPINENVTERIAEITGGLGYDVVFECSGAKPTIQAALDYAGRGATVVYVAMYGNNPAVLDLWQVFERELKITCPHQSPYTWERTMNVLPDLNLDVFTKCVFPKEQCVEAYAMQKTSTQTKVLIKIADDLD